MDAQAAVDLGREAIWNGVVMVLPFLIIGLVATLVLGVFQSVFQIHESAVSVIPRLIVMLVAIGLMLPWLSDRMLDFSREHLERPVLLSGLDTEPNGE
jgi:flagellar biosynthetic protein FliQ